LPNYSAYANLKFLAELRHIIGKEKIRDCLMQLRNAGKTILLASHHAEDIRVLCDTFCEMDGGVLTVLPTDSPR